jgi:NAD(P)-dependent dehydrogenase (short-subunit alcohol dehydrogenase family)
MASGSRSPRPLPTKATECTSPITDVSNPTAADRLFEDVRRELGGLDVLVNNAGIAGPTAPSPSTTLLRSPA